MHSPGVCRQSLGALAGPEARGRGDTKKETRPSPRARPRVRGGEGMLEGDRVQQLRRLEEKRLRVEDGAPLSRAEFCRVLRIDIKTTLEPLIKARMLKTVPWTKGQDRIPVSELRRVQREGLAQLEMERKPLAQARGGEAPSGRAAAQGIRELQESQDVNARLAELEIPLEALLTAIKAGDIARSSCTAYDPPILAGILAWGRTTRGLREELVPTGNWIAEDSQGLYSVVNQKLGIALIVVTGDSSLRTRAQNPRASTPRAPPTPRRCRRTRSRCHGN